MLAGCSASHRDYLIIKKAYPDSDVIEWSGLTFLVRKPNGEVIKATMVTSPERFRAEVLFPSFSK